MSIPNNMMKTMQIDLTSSFGLCHVNPGNFEFIFIEIQFPKKRNLIVGSDISIQDFTYLHLNPILQKISIANKQCVLLMVDFNVDRLNIYSHNHSLTQSF